MQTLPTYEFLASAGITPSASKTYTHAAMTEALKAATGYAPALNCESHVKLSAVEYYFNLKGSVIDGEFIPIGRIPISTMRSRNCRLTLYRYREYLPRRSRPGFVRLKRYQVLTQSRRFYHHNCESSIPYIDTTSSSKLYSKSGDAPTAVDYSCNYNDLGDALTYLPLGHRFLGVSPAKEPFTRA